MFQSGLAPRGAVESDGQMPVQLNGRWQGGVARYKQRYFAELICLLA